MIDAAPASVPGRRPRWTPARLIVLGAALGFVPAVLQAAVTLEADLAFLSGSLGGVPYWLFLLAAALVGILVPVGAFLAICGILLALLAASPPHPRAFRVALGGAGVDLAAGLLLGVLNLSGYLLPPELITVGFLQNVVLAEFAASVAAAAGLLVVFAGIAVLVRGPHVAGADRPALAVRVRRGKSIYRGGPSAR